MFQTAKPRKTVYFRLSLSARLHNSLPVRPAGRDMCATIRVWCMALTDSVTTSAVQRMVVEKGMPK